MKLGDQWDQHVVCKTCAENIRHWFKGFVHLCRLVHRWFGVSHKIITMIVIFACVKCLGTTKKNKEGIQYPSLSSVVKPVLHGPNIPVPTSPEPQTEISSPLDAEDVNF